MRFCSVGRKCRYIYHCKTVVMVPTLRPCGYLGEGKGEIFLSRMVCHTICNEALGGLRGNSLTNNGVKQQSWINLVQNSIEFIWLKKSLPAECSAQCFPIEWLPQRPR